MPKIALVTGANKGIGLEIARQLGERGVTVVLGARDEVRGKQAADTLAAQGLDVATLRIDVTDDATIRAAAAEIERRYGLLDILVNNAGIAGGYIGPPSGTTLDHLRDVFGTNVFGVVAVTNAMLPLLRRAEVGCIVNLASNVGSLNWQADPESPIKYVNLLAYQASKTALSSVTLAYAKELRDTSIKVNSANPGHVATDINNHAGNRTPEQGAVIAVRLALLGPDGPTGTSQDENGVVPW